MSVTFYPAAPLTITDIRLACYCPNNAGISLATTDYATAETAYLPYRDGVAPLSDLGCHRDAGECAPELVQVHEHMDAPDLSLANTNALRVLRALGYAPETTPADVASAPTGADPDGGIGDALVMLADAYQSGSDTAEQFLGHVLMAEALAPADPGMPSTQHGNVIDCGTEAGYVQHMLPQLREVGEYAARHGFNVAWG